MNEWIQLFVRQLHCEWLMHVRQLRMVLNACLFFSMVMVFFPLTMPPESTLLRTILPGLIWIGVLLALLLSSERLYQQDFEDGVMEQWLVSGQPVSIIIAAKVWMQWLITILPMILLCPFIAILFLLNVHESLVLIVSLLCGTPAILFLCALAAAFGLGIRQKGVLMALIVLPLTIPLMIFGSAAVAAAMQGLPIAGYLALLSAISLIAASILPFAITGVIYVSILD